MNSSARVIILIAAVGVPALVIFLGWTQKMAGYSVDNSDMISDGNLWMRNGAILYLIELLVAVVLYWYSRSQETYSPY